VLIDDCLSVYDITLAYEVPVALVMRAVRRIKPTAERVAV
jgi:hypothetical protein